MRHRSLAALSLILIALPVATTAAPRSSKVAAAVADTAKFNVARLKRRIATEVPALDHQGDAHAASLVRTTPP